MTNADATSQDVAPRLPAGPRRLARVVIALAGAFAFGTIDQYLQVAIPISSHLGVHQFAVQVSNGMSALWLGVPFLAGA